MHDMDKADGLGTLQCLDRDAGDCAGDVQYRTSLSGTGRAFPRCEAHWEQRLEGQRKIEEQYPQHAPSDFDPGYAGERWDEDY